MCRERFLCCGVATVLFVLGLCLGTVEAPGRVTAGNKEELWPGEAALIDVILVNDDTGRAAQVHPTVDVFGSGNFLVAWEDEGTGTGHVRARCFSRNGIPLGPSFPVSDGPFEIAEWEHSYAFSCLDTGFVVAWIEQDAGRYALRARLFSSKGSPLTGLFTLCVDSVPNDLASPAVADWPFSNCPECIGAPRGTLVDAQLVRLHFPGANSYRKFVGDLVCGVDRPPERIGRYLLE